MNELQIFENTEFGSVRTLMVNDNPYFVGKDVAEILGYSNASKAVLTHVDDEDKTFLMLEIADSQNGNVPVGQSKTAVINESGLYSLILSSKMPNAKKFKHWVTAEVLPSIRKTGAYSIPRTTAGQIQLLAQGHTELEQKIDSVNDDLQDFKRTMPLLAIECQQITDAKNRKVVSLLGGKNSKAYKNASLRGKVYRDLEGQLRREFDVRSYKAIHRNQTDKALEIINKYELPLFLWELVTEENAQVTFV